MRKLLLLCLLLAACRIDARTYSDDDGAFDASVDAPAEGGQAILVNGASTTVLTVEEGGNDTVEVTLRYPPVGSLAVLVTEDDAARATVDPPALTFDANSFNTPQTLTISGTQDSDDDPETTSVSLSATAATAATVAVTVNDDESQAVLVATGEVNVVEGGSVQVGVTLRFPPAATATVAVSSGADAVATVTPTELMFTTTNWDQPRQVTIVGAQDDNVVQDTTTIAMALANATTGTVSVTVPDNDTLGFVLSTGAVTVNENGTGPNTFTVSLSNMPSQSVVAGLAPDVAGIYTLTPDTLTFNGVNWADAQTVTVTAVGDGDDVDEATPARVTAGAITASVAVTIEDTTQIVNVGWPTPLGRFDPVGTGNLHAFRMEITGTTPVTLDKWGVITSGAGATMANMAIYTNGAGGPGSLIASSGPFAASLGQFDVPDTTTLSPGTYWLAIKLSDMVSLSQSTAAVADAYCNKMHTWATPLPTSWGAATCFAWYQYNIYLVTYR